MEASDFLPPAGEPYLGFPSGNFKAFEQIAQLLSKHTRRQAAVDHAPETAWKGALVLLGSILLNSGIDGGWELVAAVEAIISAILEDITAAPDREEALAQARGEFDPQNRETPLKVHRTTVEDLLPALTEAELNGVVEDQYVEEMTIRDASGAKSPKVTVVIDATAESVVAEHPNGTFTAVKVGGKAKWEDGFQYPCLYDVTHQMFLGAYHRGKNAASGSAGPALPPDVQALQGASATVARAGSKVALFEADRGYFKGDLFAAATFGFLSPEASPSEQPRLVVPKKFGPDKAKVTWEYLTCSDQPAVFVDHIKAFPRANSPLWEACGASFERTKDGGYEVPYACVALAGDGCQENDSALAEVRAEARVVQEGIEKSEQDLQAVETEYVAHRKQATGKEGHKPGYGRGARRKKFDDPEDERLYHECFRRREEQKKWTGKKIPLMLAVFFIAVSLRPGEDPTGHANMFVRLARDYCQRWGIENGFRDLKHAFLRKIRGAQPTRRLLNLVLGMLLYNRWHGERCRELLAACREVAWNKKPYDSRRPWNRRKLEQKIGGAVSARSFLIRVWASGIKYLIQKRFKGI